MTTETQPYSYEGIAPELKDALKSFDTNFLQGIRNWPFRPHKFIHLTDGKEIEKIFGIPKEELGSLLAEARRTGIIEYPISRRGIRISLEMDANDLRAFRALVWAYNQVGDLRMAVAVAREGLGSNPLAEKIKNPTTIPTLTREVRSSNARVTNQLDITPNVEEEVSLRTYEKVGKPLKSAFEEFERDFKPGRKENYSQSEVMAIIRRALHIQEQDRSKLVTTVVTSVALRKCIGYKIASNSKQVNERQFSADGLRLNFAMCAIRAKNPDVRLNIDELYGEVKQCLGEDSLSDALHPPVHNY